MRFECLNSLEVYYSTTDGKIGEVLSTNPYFGYIKKEAEKLLLTDVVINYDSIYWPILVFDNPFLCHCRIPFTDEMLLKYKAHPVSLSINYINSIVSEKTFDSITFRKNQIVVNEFVSGRFQDIYGDECVLSEGHFTIKGFSPDTGYVVLEYWNAKGGGTICKNGSWFVFPCAIFLDRPRKWK